MLLSCDVFDREGVVLLLHQTCDVRFFYKRISYYSRGLFGSGNLVEGSFVLSVNDYEHVSAETMT